MYDLYAKISRRYFLANFFGFCLLPPRPSFGEKRLGFFSRRVCCVVCYAIQERDFVRGRVLIDPLVAVGVCDATVVVVMDSCALRDVAASRGFEKQINVRHKTRAFTRILFGKVERDVGVAGGNS